MPLVCLNQIRFVNSGTARHLKEICQISYLRPQDSIKNIVFFLSKKKIFHFVMSVAKEILDHKLYANPVLILRMTNVQT